MQKVRKHRKRLTEYYNYLRTPRKERERKCITYKDKDFVKQFSI